MVCSILNGIDFYINGFPSALPQMLREHQERGDGKKVLGWRGVLWNALVWKYDSF